MSGCMLFLQLFYFDCVGYSASMVSKSVHPVVAWTKKTCRSMIEWISSQGGSHDGCVYISNSVGTKIWENLESDYGCQLARESVPEDVLKALFQIYGVQNEVWLVSSKMGCMEANIERVRKIIFEIGKILREMNVGVRGQLQSYTMKIGNGNEFGSVDDGSVIGIDTEPWQKRPLSSYFDGVLWHQGAYDEAAEEGDRYVEDTGADVGLKPGPVSIDDGNVGKEEDRFSLKGNLSRTEWTLLKFLFEKPARGQDKCRDEVARFGEWIMSTAEFDCLCLGNKISSKVINISAAYLFEKESDSWFLPTNFGDQACYKNQSSKVETSLASIISECGLHRFNRRLKWCSKIFIPIHDKMSEHWFLVVTRVSEKVVEIWDSNTDIVSFPRRHQMARDVILLMQKVFASDMKKPSDVYYQFSSFETKQPDCNPSNNIDWKSGVYLIRHMQLYGQPWFEGFQSNKYRSALALGIMNNPKNEALKVVTESADVSHSRSKNTLNGRDNCTGPSGDNMEAETDSELPNSDNNVNIPSGRKFRSHRKRKDLGASLTPLFPYF
ncbi:uncharacterized protein LOC133727976 isoform X2 [Rosa rugosa]|uniref:uncharacterized protein LOC133727976 isoform X2 n=1 Tax=Rosa rugosa TaxID=74645 RepID=UPI002B413D92|nr:uncharacterized protein LOC133727976 isoform X2 [Rosa rugosa]